MPASADDSPKQGSVALEALRRDLRETSKLLERFQGESEVAFGCVAPQLGVVSGRSAELVTLSDEAVRTAAAEEYAGCASSSEGSVLLRAAEERYTMEGERVVHRGRSKERTSSSYRGAAP